MKVIDFQGVQVCADDGTPLLVLGVRAGWLLLQPQPGLKRHPVSFARWTRQWIGLYRGCRVQISHPLDECTVKWMRWLGVDIPPAGAREVTL